MSRLTFIDMFAGIGGFRSGMEQAGHKCVGWIEWDKFARQSYQAMYDTEGEYDAKDIQQVQGSDLPDSDVWCFGSPCFVAGTLVQTRDGLKPIDSLKVGEEVVTIDGTYQPIVKTMVHETNKIYELKVEGNLPIHATGNHPIYAKQRTDKSTHRDGVKHIYSEPKWIPLNQLSKGDLVMNYNPKDIYHKLFKGQAWLLGRYLADGYIYDSHRKGRKNSYHHNVIFCIGSDKDDDFREHLLGYHANESTTSNKNGSVIKFSIYDKELVELCNTFGRGALNKEVAPWVFNLPIEERKEFIAGYVSGDGSRTTKPYQSVTTVSRKLALSFAKLVENTLNISASIFTSDVPKTKLFQGKRLIHQHTQYIIRYRKEKSQQQHSKIINGEFWKPVKSVILENNNGNTKVYNLEVKNNHTYNANGIIVHNCQDISLAGQQAGLEKGKKSSMFFEVIRLLKERIKNQETVPSYLLMENVKNLLSIDGGWGFARMQIELDQAGYDIEWSVINSAEVVPQNRERVYIIGHLRGASSPKVFPIIRKSQENSSGTPVKIHQVGQLNKTESFGGNPQVGRVYATDGLAPTLNTMQGGGREPKILVRACLTPDRINKRQQGRRFKDNGEPSFTLNTVDRHGVLIENQKEWAIRKLTPRECWRLQGFTDKQFNKAKEAGVSNSQLYKQIGNAVTVPVIKAIAERLR